MIYFLQIDKDGPIKIGESIDVNRRISEIQTCIPNELKLLGKFPKSKFVSEEFLHAEFKKYNIRGEWFLNRKIIRNRALALKQKNTRKLIPLNYLSNIFEASERTICQWFKSDGIIFKKIYGYNYIRERNFNKWILKRNIKIEEYRK